MKKLGKINFLKTIKIEKKNYWNMFGYANNAGRGYENQRQKVWVL